MIKAFKVEITKIEPNKELSSSVTSICSFCDKIVDLYIEDYNICKNIAHGIFHCPFCIRNNHHHGDNVNILQLSFKPIFGYYYYILYQERKLYINQISSYIEDHISIGLSNPAFSYDHSNFKWFINFNIIGLGPHKMTLNNVLDNVKQIITSLNMEELLGANEALYYNKFEDAISLFYKQRKRPLNKSLLEPTLLSCGYFNLGSANHDLVKNIEPNDFLT